MRRFKLPYIAFDEEDAAANCSQEVIEESTLAMEFGERDSQKLKEMSGLPLADFVDVRNLSILLFYEKDNSKHIWLVILDRVS